MRCPATWLWTGLLLIAVLGQPSVADDRPSEPGAANAGSADVKPVALTQDTSADTQAASETKSGTEPSKAAVARIRISGMLEDAPDAMGMFGEISPNLYQLLRRLESARTDEKVQGVWLQIRSPVIGLSRAYDIRRAVERLRRDGKKVIADLENATAADYMIAGSCDTIIMPESGMLLLPGVRLELIFYQELFDKLKIRADMLQMGKYKGASEPYSRKEMSEPFRQQMELVIDDLYDQLIDTIALDRNLSRDQVRSLIDQGLLTARAAREAGLIDHVGYREQLREQLQKSLDADTVNVQTQYGKNQVDTDFSGMSGFLKLMELMTGAKSSKAGSGKAKIALIYANGPIMTGSSQIDIFGGQTLGSDTLVSALQKAENDDSVKAVVLRINSPGGSATASDLIWHALQSMSKPTVASMSDMAASGGYYIAMGCDRIVAQPSTLTGSIGVVGGKIAVGDLMDWIGLNQQTLARGKNSGLFSADAPFTESEREVLMRLMEETYEQFTGKVAQCRKLDEQQMEAVAQGRIWTGRQAKQNGLVDELGTLRDAIDQARQLANLPSDQEPDLLILPEPRTLLEQLIEGPDVEEAQLRLPGGLVPPQWTAPLRQLYALRPVLSEPVFLCVPFVVNVR